MDLSFETITEEDVPELTRVMTRAFDDDAQRHLGEEKGGPPGYDDGGFFREWLFPYEESKGYKVLLDGRIVGGLIVWILEGGDKSYPGVIPYLEQMRREMKKGHHRFFTRRFMGDTLCRSCQGSRLREEALAVKVQGLDLGEMGRLSVEESLRKMSGIRLGKAAEAVEVNWQRGETPLQDSAAVDAALAAAGVGSPLKNPGIGVLSRVK
mgnify:CR=1 FL=1